MQPTENAEPTEAHTNENTTGDAPEPQAAVSRASSESYGGAINVIYIVDSDDDPMAGVEVDSDAEPGGDTGYYTRAGRTYYGAPREHDDFARTDAPRKSSRLQGKQAAAPRAPIASGSKRTNTRTGRARDHPIVISSDSGGPDSDSDSSSSDDSEPEDDGYIGPKYPVWIYKVKPKPRAVVPPAGPAARPSVGPPADPPAGPSASRMPRVAHPEPDGAAMSAHRARFRKPGGSGGLVQYQRRGMRPPKPPQHLERALPDLRARYPRDDVDIGYRHLPEGFIKWGYRCRTCPDAPLVTGGNPGITLRNMQGHLDGSKHAAHQWWRQEAGEGT